MTVVRLEARGSEPWRGVLTPDGLNNAVFKPHPQAMQSLLSKAESSGQENFRPLYTNPFELG